METEKSVFKVFIEGSIEAVWKEITKTDEVQRAFFNSRLHGGGAVGKKIRVTSKDGKYTMVVGEILEFDPPRRYSHTFKFTNYDDPACRVSYDLKEVPGGVEVTLTNEDVAAGTKTAKSMASGGKFIVNNLKRIIEKGDVSPVVRFFYAAFGWMTPLVAPKKTRSENWSSWDD